MLQLRAKGTKNYKIKKKKKRLESSLQIVTSQTCPDINIFKHKASNLFDTHLLIKYFSYGT